MNPTIQVRLRTARALKRAGMPVRIHVAPVSPHSDNFVHLLAECSDWIWMDLLTDTKENFRNLYLSQGWDYWLTKDAAKEEAENFIKVLGDGRVYFGKENFARGWNKE